MDGINFRIIFILAKKMYLKLQKVCIPFQIDN